MEVTRASRDTKGPAEKPKETTRGNKGFPKRPHDHPGPPKGTPRSHPRGAQEKPKGKKYKTNDFAADWRRYHKELPQHSDKNRVAKRAL